MTDLEALEQIKEYGRLEYWPDSFFEKKKELFSNKAVGRYLVSECGEFCGYYLRYLSEGLKSDKEIVLLAVNHGGKAIEHADKSLRGDFDVALAAVKNDPYSLESFDANIRDNEQIVGEAVSRNGLAIEWASERLKDDKDLAMIAIKSQPYAYKYISKRLQDTLDCVLEFLPSDSCTKFSNIDKKWFKDPEFIERGMQRCHKLINSLKREDAKKFLAKDGLLLRYLSYELTNDKELVMIAVQNNGLALRYAGKKLQDDYDVVFEAIANNNEAQKYIGDGLKDIFGDYEEEKF